MTNMKRPPEIDCFDKLSRYIELFIDNKGKMFTSFDISLQSTSDLNGLLIPRVIPELRPTGSKRTQARPRHNRQDVR